VDGTKMIQRYNKIGVDIAQKGKEKRIEKLRLSSE
jgi:hypothetical protein